MKAEQTGEFRSAARLFTLHWFLGQRQLYLCVQTSPDRSAAAANRQLPRAFRAALAITFGLSQGRSQAFRRRNLGSGFNQHGLGGEKASKPSSTFLNPRSQPGFSFSDRYFASL